VVLKPFSWGRVQLNLAAPGGAPDTRFDFQSDDRDRGRMAVAVRRAAGMLLAPEVRALWHAATPVGRTQNLRKFNDINAYNSLRAWAISAFLDLVPAASRPVLGTLSHPGLNLVSLMEDDDVLDAFVRESVAGMAHHAGSCRMGSVDDPDAVTDIQGRVHGVSGLRVVDVSIMPWVPRGNTNISTLMIARKIAAVMLGAAKACCDLRYYAILGWHRYSGEDIMSDVIKMTQDEMSDRVARFADQKGNDQLMITQSIPGFQRDIYSIIGKGVSENAGTQPGIVDSKGFNVAYVGAAPGNGSAMHTHNEEVEVFIPISGQ
jgi:hypothetical protein